jgi:hypothetical protein
MYFKGQSIVYHLSLCEVGARGGGGRRVSGAGGAASTVRTDAGAPGGPG